MASGTVLGPKYQAALAYASEHFLGHLRGNTRVPAIAHAMAVSALVLDLGADECEAIAALLHDVVEDGGGQEALDHIRATWGALVAGLVEECTDEVEPSGRPWRERKATSLARMETESAGALRIGLADKADNARTLVRGLSAIGPVLLEQHQAGDRETFLWYYETLVDLFARRADVLGDEAGPLRREFGEAVAQLRLRSVAAPEPLGSGT